MQKKIYFLLLLMIHVFTFSFSQTFPGKYVTWSFQSKKISADKWEIAMTANINGNYHMYSQKAGVEAAPATVISISPNPLILVDGSAKEKGELIKKFESAWPGTVHYYEKSVEFVQVIKVKAKAKTTFKGNIEYVLCNDARCLPTASVPFNIEVGG
jgi:thiol:disulfide interchange protein DsbD